MSWGCSTPGVAGLVRGSWSSRSRAALALGLVRDREAVPALVRVLDDPHDEIRAAAVDALGSIGDVAAVQALLARVGEQSRHQQARLVEALRRIGPAVTASVVTLGTEAPGERRMIAEILALVGGTGARVTLMEWTSDADALVCAASWRAIGMIGMDERAAYHALRALNDQDPRVRAQAAQALGRTGRLDFVPYLQSHLDDEWEVAAQGARALARLGDEGGPHSRRARTPAPADTVWNWRALPVGAAPGMREMIVSALQGFDLFVLGYFLSLNSLYLLFAVVAFFRLISHRRRWTPRALDTVMRSPATPPISLIVPAYGEEATIADSLRCCCCSTTRSSRSSSSTTDRRTARSTWRLRRSG